jgi:hypothetical protein
MLLERRIYIVVPWFRSAEERALSPFPMPFPGWRRQSAKGDDQLRMERIQRQLADRCDVVSRQLGRAGLRATRLDNLGLAHLYHVAWAPEVARTQRLRRELADYTALVVGAEARAGRRQDPQLLDRSTSR